MLNAILKWSIAQRWVVVIGAVLVTLYGFRALNHMALDVFPSFAPPQVEIQAEAPGLAPEEVESLVTLPIESAVNGTPGVTAVRSTSVAGASAVRVVFGWGTDVYQARQLITERLQQAQARLPEGVETPQLAPLNSPLGIVLEYAFTAESTPLMEVRQLVDRQVTNRLLAVPGVTQITTFGGEERQYQVLVNPAQLSAFGVTLEEVSAAAAAANQNGAGGYLIDADQELLIRGIGRIESIQDLQQAVVTAREGKPVLLQDVAEVTLGPALQRGDASLNGEPALVMLINKQPLADTLTVTEQVEAALEEVGPSLPQDVTITRTFRQADFIEASIHNVRDSLRDGIIIVSIILLLFLMNWRTAAITLSAIPMSLLICLILLDWFGLSVNTMTLGGLAVAIGSVVDDSIVDMENCYRGLRRNRQLGSPKHPFQVVYDTSVEVRTSVLFSTVIIAVIFCADFFPHRGGRAHLCADGDRLPGGDFCFYPGGPHPVACPVCVSTSRCAPARRGYLGVASQSAALSAGATIGIGATQADSVHRLRGTGSLPGAAACSGAGVSTGVSGAIAGGLDESVPRQFPGGDQPGGTGGAASSPGRSPVYDPTDAIRAGTGRPARSGL